MISCVIFKAFKSRFAAMAYVFQFFLTGQPQPRQTLPMEVLGSRSPLQDSNQHVRDQDRGGGDIAAGLGLSGHIALRDVGDTQSHRDVPGPRLRLVELG